MGPIRKIALHTVVRVVPMRRFDDAMVHGLELLRWQLWISGLPLIVIGMAVMRTGMGTLLVYAA